MKLRTAQADRRTLLCAILLTAAFASSTAAAQSARPDWAATGSMAGAKSPTAPSLENSPIQQAVYRPQSLTLRTNNQNPTSTANDKSTDEFARELTREEQLDAFAAQLPQGESHLVKFIELLQWAIVVSIIAVGAALLLRRFKPHGIQLSSNTLIEHLASLRVNNQFHAHVLEINSQRFLVTTDRGGVKTVNQMSSVNDFETALEEVI